MAGERFGKGSRKVHELIIQVPPSRPPRYMSVKHTIALLLDFV